MDPEHDKSLKPGPSPKLGTDTDTADSRQTDRHTHRIMYRVAPQLKINVTLAQDVHKKRIVELETKVINLEKKLEKIVLTTLPKR